MESIVVIHYESERSDNWALLEAAAQKRALHLITWAPHLIEIVYSDSDLRIFFNGEHVSPPVVIHRIVAPFHGIIAPALSCLTSQGTIVPNEPESAFRARDKLLTDLTLRAVGIPVVPTVAFDEPSQAAFNMLGQVEVILKPAHGVGGEGIEATFSNSAAPIASRLHNDRLNRPKFTGFHIEREHYLAQILVNGGGKDLRAYVIGPSCVALMRRRALAGEVRANLGLGARAEPLDLSHPAARIAEAALEACGLDFGGVDMVEDGDGDIRVIEVDAWAGFAGITRVTGIDVAGAILDYTIKLRRKGSKS